MRRLGAFFLGWLMAAAASAELSVSIARPRPIDVVWGDVVVIVDVDGAKEPARIELWVDGRRVATLTDAPFRTVVDVGQENVQHVFRAVARDASGATAEAAVTTPKIVVNEEMRVDLQQLYVTATRDGARVLDLGVDDFTVRDEGRRENIVTFARGDIPFTALLLVDASISMHGAKLSAAIAGAREFVAGMQELDEARLVVFSDRVRAVSKFTANADELTLGLDTLRADGGTAINDVLYLALGQMEQRQGRRVIVLLSDGVDSHSVLRMADVEEKVRRSRAQIYWICTECRETQDEMGRGAIQLFSPWRDDEAYRDEIARLREAVDSTGGRIIAVGSEGDVPGAFRELLRELREQYVLGYYPSDLKGDGRWHDVRVKTSSPGVRLRTSAGYLDF